MKSDIKNIYDNIKPFTSNNGFTDAVLSRAELAKAKKRAGIYRNNIAVLAAGLAVTTVIGLGAYAINTGFIPINNGGALAAGEDDWEAETDEDITIDMLWEYAFADLNTRVNIDTLKALANEPIYEVNQNSFENFDFDVRAVIGDNDASLLVLLEMTAKNGFEFDENADYWFKHQSEITHNGADVMTTGSYGAEPIAVINPQKAAFFYKVTAMGSFKITESIKIGNEYAMNCGDIVTEKRFGDDSEVIPGNLSFTVTANFNECDVFSYEGDDRGKATYTVIMYDVNDELDANNIENMTTEKIDTDITVRKLKLSPFLLSVEYICGEDVFDRMNELKEEYKFVDNYLDNVEIIMENGEIYTLANGDVWLYSSNYVLFGANFSELTEDGIQICFELRAPIDLNEVAQIVIGDLTYDVN